MSVNSTNRGFIMTEEEAEFIKRFEEACGTSQPTNVKRLLGVSYQAAKNYLSGRLPDARVLKLIGEKTPYSIHWLVTGKGPKMIEEPSLDDTPLLARQIREFIRQECVEVINDMSGVNQADQPKVVVLQSDKLMSEKVLVKDALADTISPEHRSREK